MHPFRDKTPQRRANREVCKCYISYRDTLKEDFNSRCGYCDDHDGFRNRSFTIDHFVPQNPIGFTTSIVVNDYYNLVYACHYCNAAKSNKWPTKNETIHNDGTVGFVDPVEQDYTNLLRRSSSGCIEPSGSNKTLAIHIISELKLWLPIHEKMWKLERIDKLIKQTKQRLDDTKDSAGTKALKETYNALLEEWHEVTKGIFVENE